MNFYVEDLIRNFYKYYPYTRYIFEQPKAIGGGSFGCLNLSEFIVIDEDSAHLKFKTLKGETLMFSIDSLSDRVQLEVRNTILRDFGSFAYACLGNDHLDRTELDSVLEKQKKLLEEKYGAALERNNTK